LPPAAYKSEARCGLRSINLIEQLAKPISSLFLLCRFRSISSMARLPVLMLVLLAAMLAAPAAFAADAGSDLAGNRHRHLLAPAPAPGSDCLALACHAAFRVDPVHAAHRHYVRYVD
jgi:hypothetical protein